MRRFRFERDGLRFEIYEIEDGSYVGYCNAQASVSSAYLDVCAIGLIRKHIVGLPSGEIINIADYFDVEKPDYPRL